jgi:CSLREA domain-containing protein
MRLLIAVLAGLFLAAPANAAEIHVNTKDDLLDPLDGKCSLREAIASANANMGMTGCAVGDATATDTIVLPVSTFMLTRGGANEDGGVDGDLDVLAGGPLVIEGNGATITAAGLDRVLDVVNVGASLTLRNLTVTGGLAPSGQPGGGILSAGTLTLIDSTVTGNGIAAAGADADGGDGGGIYSTGALTLTSSTVSDNLAGNGGPGGAGQGAEGGAGGGIYGAGTIAISRSRILRNTSGDGGAGAAVMPGGFGGRGGGLFVSGSGSGTITNSLFSGNATGAGGDGGDAVAGPGGLGGNGGDGGALAATAGVAIAHSTFIDGATGSGGHAGNGTLPGQDGGPGLATALRGGASTTVARSIITGSCFVALTDGGQNLGSGSCPGAATPPNLDAGGAPRAGSPAIDGAATAGCPATDLLGTARPQGVRCDIGAIEARATALTFSRSAFAFSALTAGLGTSTLAVTVRNPGMPGHAVPISLTGGPDFRIAAETCPAELAGGRSCAITVAFAPTRAGTRSGALRLAGRSFALSGTGLAPCVVPKLKRKTLKRARKALRRAHCTLGTVTRRGRGRRGRIRASRPKAGSVRAAGTAVDVVVNRRRARPH